MTRLLIVGATGFVGQALSAEAGRRGWNALPVSAPRYVSDASAIEQFIQRWRTGGPVAALQSLPGGPPSTMLAAMAGVDAVINAAGLATPGAGRRVTPWLMGGNALLPLVVRACQEVAGVPVFVHISSAAVCGREPLSPQARTHAITPYGRSKAAGENALSRVKDNSKYKSFIYRATSVDGLERRSQSPVAKLLEFAPILALASPDGPSPVCTAPRMAGSVLDIVQDGHSTNEIILEPSRATTWEVARQLMPRASVVPVPRRWLARIFTCAYHLAPSFKAVAMIRRVEILLAGQSYADSTNTT